MYPIQGKQALWNKQQIWVGSEKVFNMRDFHKLGRQALSVLWLCPEDKTKRYEDKTPIDGVATGKKNIDR